MHMVAARLGFEKAMVGTERATPRPDSARLCTGSASAERVGQGEVAGVTGRMLCTW